MISIWQGLSFIVFTLSWVAQAKPDVIRRLIPMDTLSDGLIVNCGATLVYLTTYMVTAGIFELTNPAPKTGARRESLKKQMILSIQAVIICVAYAVWWMVCIDPLLPFYGYYDHHPYSVMEFVKNLLTYLFIFDTWFYWTHRLLHLRKPFNFWKSIHSVHHQFTEDTTAFAQDAVHPFEGLLQGPMGHCLCFVLVPMHPLAAQLFGFGTAVFAIAAHDGRAGDLNSHVKHHHYVCVNYGLYWGLWDWVCDTRWAKGKYVPYAQAQEGGEKAKVKTN